MRDIAAPQERRRFVGIDLARFIAIVGMMSAHLLSGLAADPNAMLVGRLLNVAEILFVASTAATTFAVLGGVSLVLLTRSMRGAPAWRIYISICIRGVAIALIGWGLMQLNSPISVVLPYFGIAMIIAATALWLPSWVIGAIAAVLWVFGAAVNARVRAGLAAIPVDTTPSIPEQIARSARDLLLTGHYPAITWVAYMLTGILLARLLLRARRDGTLRRVTLWLWVAGLAVFLFLTAIGRVARYRPAWFGLPTGLDDQVLAGARGAPPGTDLWMLLMPSAHSGSPADMLRTVAGACFLIGLLVMLFDAGRPRGGFVLEAIRCAGAAPLTIYSAHVIATAAVSHWRTQQFIEGHPVSPDLPLWNFVIQVACVLAIGAVLAMLRRRGPLEALLGLVSGSSRIKRRTG
ncbi:MULTISPECIES: heparan-alpha-glucosaminide N-acetyltransferase domain-containing protein [unclassified Microbacterium]|uniref:heparan-alpha-glucosaminide N-acetyltransferase domain-containing protein n=1 Tax=unclassified Microbacterium TaxID=2609290 RepID=UPI0012FACEA0|nr:heparan-alpha-glucosaminide N-acetyltransferase domain-containing protein [Microbacterium sp. MAH-37]